MEIEQLVHYLDDPPSAAEWLRGWGVVDVGRAHGNLLRMATSGLTLDLLTVICDQLSEHLARCPDPDMALNNLERFIGAARSPLAVGTLFHRTADSLPILIQIFSNSQHLSDRLTTDQESFDLLRLTEGYPLTRQALVDELVAEIDGLEHDLDVIRALRRFKGRQTLRIAYGDIVREQPLRTVSSQISHLADAVLEAALRAAWRKTIKQHGTPIGHDAKPATFVVLALGKLGGGELNYSSDIDLILLYGSDGQTDGRRQLTNNEFFSQLAREFVRLLTETTELGAAYRVDLRLRPDGQRGPMVISVESAAAYYDIRGRTWERQAFIKARPVAGDLQLGAKFLKRLRSWIYRRYLSRADISGIKALKRRIEKRAYDQGADNRDVKTGRGGIRDVEFVIQFLQLLNGGDLPELQTGNTLEAIAQLGNVGCLSNLERSLLEENYSFLRKIEHRLQIMFDLQTHLLPGDPDELRKLALRMGYADTRKRRALDAFESDYRDRTRLNRKILDHLLHEAFSDDTNTEAEADLVLDPDPPENRIAEVLGKYPFHDVKNAYRNLMALAEEKIRFLSTRRCRHFLAAIAPELLQAIAATPDPDSTLVNLGKVSDSLGGKGVLWELFSFNAPSLRLYVELCAYSPYLSEILTSNPGMCDGLMDSLVLDKLPSAKSLGRGLADLCRAAEDLDPILLSFKNDQQLRVGVRDILGRDDIREISQTLSDIAEACLVQIADRKYMELTGKLGVPSGDDGAGAGQTCEMVILAMGKLGGREMNYHSDLDIVFLYEADGQTVQPTHSAGGETTTNQHFFSELGQRIIKTASHLNAYGRLYQVDARLRPTGRSGVLATSFGQFARYFAEGGGQLWERQALCKARVVYGSDRAAKAAMQAVYRAAFEHDWEADNTEEIRRMRQRIEEQAGRRDVKRGPGGMVDIEFLVQMLQLKHGRDDPSLRIPNTEAALEALHRAGHLSRVDREFFSDGYRFLRHLRGGLGLISTTPRDDLPDEPTELAKLAHLLHHADGESLPAEFDKCTAEIRKRFNRLLDDR